MDAHSFLEIGDLDKTRQRLIHALRDNPTDQASRTFLFETQCFSGEFEKAEQQLKLLGSQDPTNQYGFHVYRDLLLAEKKRTQMFSYGGVPDFFHPPARYLELLLGAIKYVGESRYGQARELLEASCQDWPLVQGTVNNRHFSVIRDGCNLLAPILEVMVGSRYYWVPWNELKKLQFKAPKYLRDLYWAQAQLSLREGQQFPVFIPVLYPRTFSTLEEPVKLGRLTIWEELGDGITRGKGQRLFECDDREFPILEVATLEFS